MTTDLVRERPPSPPLDTDTDTTGSPPAATSTASGGTAPRRSWSRRRLAACLAFPLLATFGFALLVGLGWNGSSSSLLRTYLEEPGPDPDPQRVFGSPNRVRSDEWAVITPLLVAQAGSGYDRVNTDAFGGTDVSIFSAVPYRSWSTVFRPQHLGFLVLPFDQAFAFHWWFPAWLLAMGSYGLALGFCPRRPGLAAAAALAITLAPFVHWWFLTITTGSLGWAAVLVALFVLLERCRSRAALLATVAAIGYASAAFLLLLYPAFQIPCAWVLLACVVGWCFRAGAPTTLRHRVERLGWATAGGAAGAAVFGVFVLTRWNTIQLQANTEYPGGRMIPSGGGDAVWLFSGFLDRYLSPDLALPGSLGGNPSETSSFVLTGIFLTIPAVWLLVRGWRQRLGVDGLLVALLAVLVLFLAFMFVPGLDLLARVTLLSQVMPHRLYIGLGLLSLALTVAVLREMDRQRTRPPWAVVGLVGVVTLAVHGRVGLRVADLAPAWSGGVLRWLPLALVATAIVVLVARGYGAVALGALATFSAVAVYRVNPLHSGVYDTRETALSEAIVAVDEADPGGWIAMGSALNSAVLTMQPVERYSGTALYPNFDVWAELDPTGENRPVYNRFAHVAFTDDPEAVGLAVPYPDHVVARFHGCGPFAQNRLRHVLSSKPVADDCLTLNRKVHMPASTFYIYDIRSVSAQRQA